MKDIAKECNISERTVFRCFESKERLLDDLSILVIDKLKSPNVPSEVSELSNYVQDLFDSFEKDIQLTQAALQKEIFDRIRESQVKKRWKEVKKLITTALPKLPKCSQEIISGNIRFLLSASTWNYYRFHLGFSKKKAVDSVRFAINAQLDNCEELGMGN